MKAYNKEELQRLIAHAEIELVMSMVEDAPAIQEEQNLYQKLGMLRKEYKDVVRRDRMGILGASETNQIKNRITWDLLELVNELP